MQATSKLRTLRKLKTRDHGNSPKMSSSTARRDLQLMDKRANRATTSWASESSDATDPTPLSLRRNSSSEIQIPQFMIPSSASSLMDKHYALSPPSSMTNSFQGASYTTAMPLRQ